MTSVNPDIYPLPITSNNHDSQEVYSDILFNLSHLNNLSEEIFKQIEDRVNKEYLRLNQINSRLTSCQEKVSYIKKSEGKAITIFSTSKFPAEKNLPNYPTLLGPPKNVSKNIGINFLFILFFFSSFTLIFFLLTLISQYFFYFF